MDVRILIQTYYFVMNNKTRNIILIGWKHIQNNLLS